MIYKKMVIVGDVGAGKGQLIQTLSEISTASTGIESSENYTHAGVKYGRVTLYDGVELGLYGLHDTRHFDSLKTLFEESLWGVLILLRYSKNTQSANIKKTLAQFKTHNVVAPIMVGITHCETAPQKAVDSMVKALNSVLDNHGLKAPIIPIDPRDIESSILPLTVFSSLKREQHNSVYLGEHYSSK